MSYLSGKTVYLRAVEPEDLDTLYRYENDPLLWPYGNTLAPYSRFALQEYLKHAQDDIFQTRQLRLMIVRSDDDRPVGIIDLFDFEPHHARAAVGILVFPGEQHRGIGSEALELLSDYAFGVLHLHQLYAHIPESNTLSRRLFSRCGYTECGRLNEWLRTAPQQYENVIVVQKTEA